MLNDSMRIASTLAQARAKAHVTQETLAERLNTSTSTVQRIERGEKSPTLEDFIGWHRALGLNWFHNIMRIVTPELYTAPDGIPDIDLCRTCLFQYLSDCPPGEVGKLAFLIFGSHGSDWPSMLDEYTANAHCSMHSRAAVCCLIMENYELESATGELVECGKAYPNIENLRAAHEATKQAVKSKKAII